MKDFNEFELRCNKIGNCANEYITKYGTIGHAESYCTAKVLYAYVLATKDSTNMYLQCHQQYSNLMKLSHNIVGDDAKEQKEIDGFFFGAEKHMNTTTKVLIRILRSYQIVGQYRCDNGDNDLIVECRKLVQLIDECIAYIQDGNIH